MGGLTLVVTSMSFVAQYDVRVVKLESAARATTRRCRRQVFFQGRKLRTSHLPRAARQASPRSHDSLPSLT